MFDLASSHRRSRGRLRFAAGLALGMTPPARAAVIHVAVVGDDTASGTEIAPLQTIQRCADLAQPGDTCRVHAGTYRETVTAPRSGNATAAIRFEAAPGECVTVSGADPLQVSWSPYSGSIWMARPNKRFIQLFVSGKMLNEARWPDADPDDLVHMPRARAGVGTDVNGLVATNAPAGDWSGAYVHVLPGQGWQSHTRQVLQYDEATHRIAFDRPVDLPSLTPRFGNFYYLFGSLLALDSEGEWFLDTASGLLYLWPPQSTDPNQSASIEVKQRAYAFDVSHRSYIEIVGFRLFGATIRLVSADHCTVDAVRARYVTHLRETDGYATLGDVSILSGSNNVWKNSVIAHSASSGIYIEGANNQVVNNVIHDVAYMGTNHAAIDLSNYQVATEGSEITHNTVARSGRGGIYMMGSSAGKVLYNLVQDTALLTEDMGGIYAWGTDGGGTEVGYNEVSGVNSIYGTGVYLDEGARNFIVHHNYVHDVAFVGTQMKAANWLLNNTVERARIAPFMMGATADGTWDDVASARLIDNLHDGRTGIRFELQTRNVTDYGNYAVEFSVDQNWSHVSFPFDSFAQPNWANSVPLELDLVQSLAWSPQTPGRFEIEVDNVRFEGQSPMLVAGFDGGGLTNSLGASASGSSGAGSSLALTAIDSGDAGSGGAARITGTSVVGGWASFSMPLAVSNTGTFDASQFSGVSFDVRGTTDFHLAAADVAPDQHGNAVCPLDVQHVPTTECAVDRGDVVAPYTDGYAGALPDLGAFESGKPAWTAGADFEEDWESCGPPGATSSLADAGADEGVTPAVDAGESAPSNSTASAAGSGCGCKVSRPSSSLHAILGIILLSVLAGFRMSNSRDERL